MPLHSFHQHNILSLTQPAFSIKGNGICNLVIHTFIPIVRIPENRETRPSVSTRRGWSGMLERKELPAFYRKQPLFITLRLHKVRHPASSADKASLQRPAFLTLAS